MITGDVSLKVSLPSIGYRNEWFLMARRRVSRRIRAMDTVLTTNKLKGMIRLAQPPES